VRAPEQTKRHFKKYIIILVVYENDGPNNNAKMVVIKYIVSGVSVLFGLVLCM